MVRIADLLDQARTAGASFEVSGSRVGVTGASVIPTEIRDALKARRDEVFRHLAGDTAGPLTSQAILRDTGVEVILVEDDEAADVALAEILVDAGSGPVGLDVETTVSAGVEVRSTVRLTRTGVSVRSAKKDQSDAALDPHRADVRLVQIYGGGKRCAVFDMRQVSWATLAPLWRHRLVIHNLQFESKFLHRLGIVSDAAECSLQAAGLLLGVHRRGLAAAAREYLGWDMPKDLQKSDWGVPVLSTEQVDYAALDAVAALLLWHRLEKELHSKRRWGAYVLQRDAIQAAVEMESAGIGVDVDAIDTIISKWNRDLALARSEWQAETGTPPPHTANQIRQWLSENLDPAALAAWPRTKTSKQLSTSAGDMERAAYLPGVRPLLDIRRRETLLSSFGTSLRDKINSVTGRIHPNYLVAGTKSGRWSCKSPNLQQMPGERLAPGFRSIFIAPPGGVLIGADYSQMELRAAAEISRDEALRAIYADGRDLHVITAADMMGVDQDEVTKQQRSRAKPVNFGSIYGMGPKGLAAAAWNGYRVEMTVTEAGRALKVFFRRFPRLYAWMRENADICQQRHRINIGAGRVLENAWEPDGIRYTQCCNLPVQGACADAMMRAVAAIHRRIRSEEIDAVLVAQIHDEVILEADKQNAAVAAQIVEEEMVAAFIETFPGAPTTGLVDVKNGGSWADLK